MFFVLWWLCSLHAHASQATPLALIGPVSETRLEPHVSWLCDPSGKLTLDAVRQKSLQPLVHPNIVLGYRRGACWFHFRLENHSSIALPLILQINYPVLDRIELYAPGAAEQDYLLLGDQLPFGQRPLATRVFAIPLSLPAGQQQDYFLRVASTSSLNVPLTLGSPAAFLNQHELSEWLHGAGFGIAIGLIIYHLFLWLAVREKVYRFYVLYMVAAFFYLLCYQGMAYRLWPEAAQWNAHAQLVFIFLMFAAGSQFARDYLRTEYWPAADHTLLALVLVALGAGILQFMLPLALAYQLQPLIALPVLTIIPAIALLRLRQGNREAGLFLLAWGLLTLVAIILSLQAFGFFSSLPIMFTLNGMGLAFILQLLLLALALANRLNTLKQEKSEQKQTLLRAEAENAATTEFLAKMSHEVRTPMNALLGITQLLQDTTLNDMQKNYVDTLYNSGHDLLNVINDILDYSKIAAGKIELELVDFNLPDMLDECIQVFSPSARKKPLALVCERAPDLPAHVRGDAGRLRQVLLNLLSNAIKFTEHGKVTLRASVEEMTATRVRLCFEVEDSGIGIAPEKIPTLFESFMRGDFSPSRQYSGSGLGLAISRQLVELMHGKISVSSQAGKGTLFRFNVLLKTVATHPAIPEPRQLPAPVSFTGVRALVVEDNPVNQLVIQGFLRKLDITTRIACGGAEALEILQQEGTVFDLVFMDCEMPFMDGFETTRQLRAWEQSKQRQPLYIIALTAHALPQHREQCLAAGMNDYLSKPLLLSHLVEKLQDALGGSTA